MNIHLGLSRTLIIVGINARVPTGTMEETDVLFSSAKLSIKNEKKEEDPCCSVMFNYAGTGPILGNGFLHRGFS